MKPKKKIKDIFVDDCIAVRLENPLDIKLKSFLEWLEVNGSLVLTPKIIAEYQASLSLCAGSTFLTILNKCISEGRCVEFTNQDLKLFRFKKKDSSKLRSNTKDHWHLKAVMLSPRKIAVSRDNNFIHDVNNFPGYGATADKDINNLKYK